MKILDNVMKVITAIADGHPESIKPEFHSKDDFRMTQAACALTFGKNKCDPSQSSTGNMALYLSSAMQPIYTKSTSDQYDFKWDNQSFRMFCSEGKCNVYTSAQPKEDISIAQVVFGILSGPAGCTVEEPRPSEATKPPKEVSFPDKLVFCASKIKQMSCFSKKDYQELGLSECIYLDGIYKDKNGQDLILPEANNFDSLLLYLSKVAPQDLTPYNVADYWREYGFFTKISSTSLWDLNKIGPVSNQIVLDCQSWWISDNTVVSDGQHSPMKQFGYANWGEGRHSFYCPNNENPTIGFAANKTEHRILIYINDPIHNCQAEYSANK